ncbi:MAG: hypothetical protein ACLS3F_12065 [Oscillospiraceae bacterium]
MSVKTVQRYIWLNDLVPELKQTMDDGKLSFTPAVEISRVRPKHQKYIAVSIEGQQASPSKGQAKRIRELDKENKLSPDVIDGILCEEKKKEDRDVIITGAELEKFFGKEATPRQMKDQDHDAAGGLERAAAARACQARQENGYGEVTTSGHHDQRLFAALSGVPRKVARLCGERRRNGIIELLPSGKSEGYEVCADDVALAVVSPVAARN